MRSTCCAVDNAPDCFFSWISDEIVELIFHWIDHAADRQAISEVCKRWHRIDGLTRKKLTIGFAYSAPPSALSQRFKNLLALTIKGKPRVSEFGLISKDWGGSSQTWIAELVESRWKTGAYGALSTLHLKRMDVSDEDLCLISQAFCSSLEVLKLDKCSGFSTSGLVAITRACRSLRVLYLDESQIEDTGSEWLQELALGNPYLEVLSIFLTGLDLQNPAYVALILSNCKSLRCLKLNEVGPGLSRDVFNTSTSLKELGVLFGGVNRNSTGFSLPKTLTSFAGDLSFPLDHTVVSNISELDLMSTNLNADEHIEVITHCPNLEVLKLRNMIGDDGVATVAQNCSKLRKIRMENMEESQRNFSFPGMISLASRCINLQKVSLYVSDVTNAALQTFGGNCPNLCDFRIGILESDVPTTDLPLDRGVKALMEGCRKITRLAIYLRKGGLTDAGMCEIGKLGENLKWMLLACVGDSDSGFIQMAAGCQRLVKLELRDCPFTETGIATGIRMMRSLNFAWIQKYKEENPYDLLQMGEWVVEYIVPSGNLPAQILAYRSVATYRTDFPPHVVPLSLVASRYYHTSMTEEMSSCSH